MLSFMLGDSMASLDAARGICGSLSLLQRTFYIKNFCSNLPRPTEKTNLILTCKYEHFLSTSLLT